jgi:hypothetical protein
MGTSQPKQIESTENKTENLNRTTDQTELSNMLNQAYNSAFGSQTGMTVRGPLEAQQPLFQNLWNTAGNAMQTVQANPFSPQNFIAQSGGDATVGVNALRTLLNSGSIGQGAQDVINMGQATARGDYLRPETNPFLQSNVDTAIGRVREGLLERALPQISDAAIAGGAYGGARQDLSQENAVRDFGRTAAETASQMYGQNYAAERDRQMQAGNVLSQGYDLASAQGRGLLSLDDIVRSQQQLAIDDAAARYQANDPFRGLTELAGLLTAGGFGQTGQTGQTANFGTSGGLTQGSTAMHSDVVGTGTSQTNKTMDNPAYEDPFTRMLKLALGGASSIAALGGKGGFNLWGR